MLELSGVQISLAKKHRYGEVYIDLKEYEDTNTKGRYTPLHKFLRDIGCTPEDVADAYRHMINEGTPRQAEEGEG